MTSQVLILIFSNIAHVDWDISAAQMDNIFIYHQTGVYVSGNLEVGKLRERSYKGQCQGMS